MGENFWVRRIATTTLPMGENDWVRGGAVFFFWEGAGVPNVIFEERLNGEFSEIVVEFNSESGRENLAKATNFSGNLPDSLDSTRFRKL